MRRPDIDFRQTGSLRRALFGSSGGVVSIASATVFLTAMCSLAAAGWRSQEAAAALSLETARLSRAADSASTQAVPRTSLRDPETAAFSRVAKHLNMPWSQLLDTLEASLPENVGLISIEPDAGTGRVRIVAEAKSLDELVSYSGKLREVTSVASVSPVRHETLDQDPNKPVRIVLDIRMGRTVQKVQ